MMLSIELPLLAWLCFVSGTFLSGVYVGGKYLGGKYILEMRRIKKPRKGWVCIHGVQEKYGSHSCEECKAIAKRLGSAFDEKDSTYIFTQEIIDAIKIDKDKKKILEEMGI